MRPFGLTLTFLFIVALATNSTAQTTVANMRQANAILEKALIANGVAQLNLVKNLSLRMEGKKFMDGQTFDFRKPDTPLMAAQQVDIDFSNNKLVYETEDRYLGGYLFHFRAVYTDTAAFSYEVPKIHFNSITPLQPSTITTQRQALLRNLPPYILKSAASNRLALRYAGD